MICTPTPPEPRASLRNAIDAKCRDCGAGDAGAHWRLHVAACTVTICPLWNVRPLPKSAPQWLATRNPVNLPTGWARMSIEAAIRSIGGTVTGLSGDAMRLPDREAPSDADDAANTVLGGGQ